MMAFVTVAVSMRDALEMSLEFADGERLVKLAKDDALANLERRPL